MLKSITRWGDTKLGTEYARSFSEKALKIMNIKLELEGLENLKNQPCIYTLNHQSNFDMATFGAVYPENTVIIGKKELIWFPFFGLFYKASGNIMIDRKNKTKAIDSLDQVVSEIKNRKVSVWVFPEGTRNKTGKGLLPFKKGSFHMAIAAKVPVVPVVCSPVKKVIDSKNKKFLGGTLKIQVLPPISTKDMTEKDVEPLMNLVREKMLFVVDNA
ncbi:MAG: lysophospholipid acyltransferase family protein [Candidatus Sericytochromatia bacterium]